MTWEPGTLGVLRLPSGRRVRGRGLRRPLPDGPMPDFGVYLLGAPPEPLPWTWRWVRWRDGWVPADPGELRAVLEEVRERAAVERVEFACAGGLGRTGTALACLAILDGVPAAEAVAYVRNGYARRAVEMPWQRRFVRGFRP